MSIFKHPLWGRLSKVGPPFFTQGPRRAARGGLALLFLLLLAINGLKIVNSYVGRDFMTSLAERRLERFYWLALLLAGVFAASTTAEAVNSYLKQRLALRWREWLTRLLINRYLAERAGHRLAGRDDVDNPDQRISEDVRSFTDASLSFLILLVNGVLTLVAFIGVLWSITPWLVAAALGYAVLGTAGTVLLGRRLVALDNQQLRKEADFRYALIRTRDRAEVGAPVEDGHHERLGERLAAVVANFRSIITVNLRLGFFTGGYNYLTQIIPAAVVAPLYIRGEVEFGAVTQAAMAFSQVLGAFSLLVSQFQNLSSYAAVANRLGQLWEATEPATPDPRPPAAASVPSGSCP
jgi:putative ATP-binding cassette transporter